MKPGLLVGHCFEFTIRVTEAMRPQFEGQVIHSVYSTAAMLNHMEWAARQHVLPYLEAGEESVGYHIELTHQAPAPIGAVVRIRSTVIQPGHAKVVSQVEAWWNETRLGHGVLTQAIVPLHKLQVAAGKAQPPVPSQIPQAKREGVAILQAHQGNQFVGLQLLGWEAEGSACTRYDEWLMVKLSLQGRTQQDEISFEAPCLLHYEVEELASSLRAVAAGERTAYQSDFLEGIFNLFVEANDANGCTVRVVVQGTPALTEPVVFSFEVTLKAILAWADAIHAQWDAFPSRL